MLRRPARALLSGIVAWCAVTAVDHARVPTAGRSGFGPDAEHALLSPSTRSEPRLARSKGAPGAESHAGGSLLALWTDVPALAITAATVVRHPGEDAPRVVLDRTSPRSSRGPPA